MTTPLIEENFFLPSGDAHRIECFAWLCRNRAMQCRQLVAIPRNHVHYHFYIFVMHFFNNQSRISFKNFRIKFK